MSFSFGLSPVLLVVCVLAAAALTYWSYRRTTPPLPASRRFILGGLRFATLFLVLFLLFEPIMRHIDRDTHPPVLAVLVDDSQSLGLAVQSEDSLSAEVKEVIRQQIANLPIDPEDLGGEPVVYAFGGNTRMVGDDRSSWVDSIQFEGERTDITQSLEYIREDLRDKNLRGVLLISDGLYNTGRNPLYTAERYPVPIHTYVLGDTTSQRDIQIRRINTNEIAYLGSDQPVQVAVRAEGYSGEEVTVSLLREGETLSNRRVRLPEGTAEVNVDLAYKPWAVGLHRLTVAVSHKEGELTYQNNTGSFTVRVLEQKKRILLLGAAPNPDVSAIHQILEQNEDSEVVPFIQKAPGSFYQGMLPDDLSEFDLILLAGYPGGASDPNVVQRVARAAEQGTPLLFVISRQTDVALLQGELGEYLPVIPEAARASFVEAMFVPTEEGLRDPILDLSNASPQAWRRLPPLAYNESRWRAAPDARVLATLEVRGVALNDPMLVVRRRAGSRSAALLAADTRRWKNVPADLEDVENVWPELLSNLVQWVTAHEDDRPVRVEPVEEVFGGEESVAFTGEVYDESLNPVDDASIEVELVTPDSTRYPLRMSSLGNGRYTLDAGSFPEGTYQYTAIAKRKGVTLGTDEGTFAVGALTLEYRDTRADAGLMRQIAHRSGGKFVSKEELNTLPSVLSSTGGFVGVEYTEERDTELWHLYWFLVAIVLLLTTEWFLRKRSGMV